MDVEGIVLAAGLSSRMGKYKMSLKIGDKTLIERCIEPMYDICSSIIVVGGYNFNLINRILKPYTKVKAVLNSSYQEGMFSSVKLGLSEIKAERFFLIPGDYPLVKSKTYEKMLSEDGEVVLPLYNGKSGHPILVKSNAIDDILNNKSYVALRDFIRQSQITNVEVEDPGILIDMDTIDDYKKVLGYYQ